MAQGLFPRDEEKPEKKDFQKDVTDLWKAWHPDWTNAQIHDGITVASKGNVLRYVSSLGEVLMSSFGQGVCDAMGRLNPKPGPCPPESFSELDKCEYQRGWNYAKEFLADYANRNT